MFIQSVTYDPKTRQYQLRNSDDQTVEAFPAGDAGRQAAKERTVQLNDPQVYRLAWYYAYDLHRHRKDLFNRIWKAAQMVTEGKAQPRYLADPVSLVARVQSSSQKRWSELHQENRPVEYGINKLPNGRLSCHCFDHVNAAPKVDNQPMCWHVIAAKIMISLQPHKYGHMHGVSPDMSAALQSAANARPAPKPAAENTELTQALKSMRKKQAELYPTDQTQKEPQTAVNIAELNAFLFD